MPCDSQASCGRITAWQSVLLPLPPALLRHASDKRFPQALLPFSCRTTPPAMLHARRHIASRSSRSRSFGQCRPALRAASSWGAGPRSFQVIDTHCEGEPARIVVGGMPTVPGDTMFEKRNYMMEHMDDLRTMLITEPRGYPCQNADVILPPTLPEAAFGYVILEQNKIYPAMSGHNTICAATALLETGMIPMVEPVTSFTLEAPAGLIEIDAACSNGKATEITLKNQPAFVAPGGLDVKINVPTFGEVSVDVAYGGMWYCIVDAQSMGLVLSPASGKEICRLGEMVKVACREQFPVNHPLFEYPGCDIMVFRGPPTPGSGATSKNAVVMSNGVLDWCGKRLFSIAMPFCTLTKKIEYLPRQARDKHRGK